MNNLFNAQKEALLSEGFNFTDAEIQKLVEIFKIEQQAARIEQLTASLTRMLEKHDLMMKKVNFGASFLDAECLMEINTAPAQARALLDGVQK
ncbi:hypothetical protein [Pragia fontium]|uniref:hypothetical protein n=1 Tax=Pragia fontium TaxID=82985 RepID=UPI00064A0D68|nr:hypothetical protein [Pragia fontium]AKJ41767.1 hypothetical protein QQ39_06445 [Pragia fontium]